MADHKSKRKGNKQILEQTAKELLNDYINDDELTIFKVLDSEDFQFPEIPLNLPLIKGHF